VRRIFYLRPGSVTLIVNRIVFDKELNSWRIISSGDSENEIDGNLFKETFPSLEEAKRAAEIFRTKGNSVTVRPNYNEVSNERVFFREWRSFDGEELKEIRFDNVYETSR